MSTLTIDPKHTPHISPEQHAATILSLCNSQNRDRCRVALAACRQRRREITAMTMRCIEPEATHSPELGSPEYEARVMAAIAALRGDN